MGVISPIVLYFLLLILLLVLNFIVIPKAITNLFIKRINANETKFSDFYLDLFARYSFFVKCT